MRADRYAWAALLLALSCTNDFNAFEVGPKGSGGAGGGGVDSSAGGAISDGGTGGAGGSSVGGAGGAPLQDGGTGGAGVLDGSTGGGTGGIGGSPTDGSSGGSPPDGATGGTPGTGGADAAAGGTPGTGGTAATGGTAGTGGSATDGAVVCTAQQKQCGSLCTALTNPATGCADLATCAACSLPHVTTPVCNGAGDCAPGTCASGFGDCNTTAGDGCERAITGDPLNCGSCDRLCSTTNASSRACSGSQCTSTCELGYANCSHPTSGADDGCERDVRANNTSCGSCTNSCSAQGLVCLSSLCGCTLDTQCKALGPPGGATPTCDVGTGQCHCGTTVCARGEQCRQGACSCNAGTACASGQTCCQNPAGCFDLSNDPANCGACGRACPSGFACVAGACQCDADPDCSAGTPGACTTATGLCTCGNTICLEGQRCLGSGQCG